MCDFKTIEKGVLNDNLNTWNSWCRSKDFELILGNLTKQRRIKSMKILIHPGDCFEKEGNKSGFFNFKILSNQMH